MQFNTEERDTISSVTQRVMLVTGNTVTTYGQAAVQNFFRQHGALHKSRATKARQRPAGETKNKFRNYERKT